MLTSTIMKGNNQVNGTTITAKQLHELPIDKQRQVDEILKMLQVKNV